MNEVNENTLLKQKIDYLIEMEERYKEFNKFNETMIQRLKEENEILRQKNIELEKELTFKSKAIEKDQKRKKDKAIYDDLMISFRSTNQGFP